MAHVIFLVVVREANEVYFYVYSLRFFVAVLRVAFGELFDRKRHRLHPFVIIFVV